MIIKGPYRKANIFGNLLYFASVISDYTDLEELKILSVGLKRSHVSFHDVAHSIVVGSCFELGFGKVFFDDTSGVMGSVVHKEFENSLVFFGHGFMICWIN